MGKPADLKEKEKKGLAARWPFDPMQPGIGGERNRSPKGDRR